MSGHHPTQWFAHAILIAMSTMLLLSDITGAASDTLTWQDIPGGRAAALPALESASSGFTLMEPKRTSILFTNELPRWRYMTNQVLPSGSGVTAGDVDGDGWCDLFFSGLNSSNRLYRNHGNWRFEDITQIAGLAGPNLDATGATFADLDGDGDLDLVLNTIGTRTRLWFNNGSGRFTESPVPLNPGRAGMTSALADVDGDGDLDLFVGGRVMGGSYPEAVSSLTYRNVGGRFEPDALNRGVLENIGMLSGAVFADLTGDGLPELVLAARMGPHPSAGE